MSILAGKYRGNYKNRTEPILSVFSGIEEVLVTKSYSFNNKLNKNGDFLIGDDDSLSLNNLANNKSYIDEYPTLTPVGAFSRFEKKNMSLINKYFKDVETNSSVFFTNENEITDFEVAYPNSKRTAITLLGPLIYQNIVDDLLNNRGAFINLKNLFLVGTSCSSKDIKALRDIAENSKVRIHQINSPSSLMINQNYYFDNQWFHRQHQQFMQHQMNQSIQNNIPKF